MNPDVDSTPFTFRLERVKSLRERAEDQAREELGRTLTHRVRGEALVRQAGDVVSAARDSGRDAVLRGASGADLIAAQAWLERAERRRLDAVADLKRREMEVELRREALAAAAREREAIERLERRRRADHEAEMGRRAQAALDEVALTVHRRGTAG
jgi:flagellar FliJ protein